MAGEMLFLANQGVDILRMDAVAFIWKQLGTPCENLPEAHLLLRRSTPCAGSRHRRSCSSPRRSSTPTRWRSTSIPRECQLSYNPLQMALIWEAMATRDVSLLAQALERRHNIPAATSWVNYVRSHDDIGWTFADEDAAELGINGFDHRRFLNSFYVNRFPGSFARGVPFQDNPRTGDCRISGTTASLCGLEDGTGQAVDRILLAHSVAFSTGGIPLLYLGDEVGQLNDYDYALEDGHGTDSRWVHRPHYPAARYARRHDAATPEGAVFAGLRNMIAVRSRTPELAGTRLLDFDTKNPGVLGYQRPGDGTTDPGAGQLQRPGPDSGRGDALRIRRGRPRSPDRGPHGAWAGHRAQTAAVRLAEGYAAALILGVPPGLRDLGRRPEQPAGDVAPQDKVGSSGGTHAAGGNVVPASGTRTTGCTVQGIGEVSGQMTRGAEGPQAVEFFRREPSEHCSDIGHHESLLADGA